MPSKTVTVAVAPGSRIAEADGARTVLTIQNLDNVNYVDISDDSTAGLRLYPHEKITILAVDGDEPEKRWNGIASVALEVRILETFDPAHRRPLDPDRQRVRTAASRRGTTGSPPAPPGGAGGDPGSFPR